MTIHSVFCYVFMTLLLASLCACGQESNPSDEPGDPEARSQRLSEIQALTDSAREAHGLLEGVWDAELVYTAPSGAEARLETVLTFQRDGDNVTWTEAYDQTALNAIIDEAQDGQALLVWPKTTLLAGGFDKGYVYINKLHLVFDEHASFDAGAEARQKAYDAIRNHEANLFDQITAIYYQPYVVSSVQANRIVLRRPARVFPEAVEQGLIAEDENPDQIGGQLELILTQRPGP